MQPIRFGFTPQQAARLLGKKAHEPYSHKRRHGHWLGIKFVKLPNGRLVLPRAEVLRVAGLAPDGVSPLPDSSAFIACLEAFGLPDNDEALRAFGGKALSHKVDHGRDPAYVLDELRFQFESDDAVISRLQDAYSAMQPEEQERAKDLARLQRQHWESAFQAMADVDKESK